LAEKLLLPSGGTLDRADPTLYWIQFADSRRANVLVYYNWFGISDGWHNLAAEALAVAAISKIPLDRFVNTIYP
jgi:hypothetical protein